MVGEPLPDSCLTKRVLRADTDAFERSPAVAWATTLVAIAGLLWFALRRIAWVPRVAAVTEHRVASPIPDSGSAAIELMRSTDAERESRMEAEADGHDLRHPWWVGLAIGVIPLIVMSLLVGWGTSLSWARRPGLLIFLGLGLISLPMVLGRFQRSDMHPMIMRLQFLGGVSVGMLLLFLTGMGLRGLLLNLNGVAWPF